jgi:hypothetical protein
MSDRCNHVHVPRVGEEPRGKCTLPFGHDRHVYEQDLGAAGSPSETAEAQVARYERALKAIKDSKLGGVAFGDWVQSCVEDVLDGSEAECPECGTVVHEGPCVGNGEE